MVRWTDISGRTLTLALLGLSGAAWAQSTAAGTASGLVISRVDPSVPEGAPANSSAGCRVVFEVGTEGAPTAVQATECEPIYAEAAEAAAWQWRFKPNVLGGNAYPYRYTAQIEFRKTTSDSTVHHTMAADGTKATSGVVVEQRKEPEIPSDWRRLAEAEGLSEVSWRVRIHVDAFGVPEKIEVVESPAFLKTALEAAGKQWRFEPLVVDGKERPYVYMWTTTWVTL